MKTKFDSLKIGNFTFDWGSRTYVMGILNVTPDSFSGDGLMANGDRIELALRQAEYFLHHQADILDVGGESTRPGSQPVTADQELERVIPAIQAIQNNFPDALISIDTYKAKVAEEAFKAGAQILNDLGVKTMRLLTNNPRKFVGLQGYGLSISDAVPLEIPASDTTRRYLKTKKDKLGHRLSSV